MQTINDEQSGETTIQTSDNDNDGESHANTHPADNAPQLSEIELRVLGVLMEKQLTTPDQYPLTLNSVITACNQKSSREPVSNYNQGEVHRALQELDNKHFVRKERSSRSEKFSQLFMSHLELGRNQQALLCVMMLRGPQTVSELNTRTQRMHQFTDKDELEHCIDRLCNRDVPYAIRLAQQPGQRGERVAHLFSDKPIYNSLPNAHSSAAQPDRGTLDTYENPEQTVNSRDTQSKDDRIALLESEIATLNDSLSTLKAETAELKQQVAVLSRLAGLTS